MPKEQKPPEAACSPESQPWAGDLPGLTAAFSLRLCSAHTARQRSPASETRTQRYLCEPVFTAGGVAREQTGALMSWVTGMQMKRGCLPAGSSCRADAEKVLSLRKPVPGVNMKFKEVTVAVSLDCRLSRPFLRVPALLLPANTLTFLKQM